jgi:hypothetical protein
MTAQHFVVRDMVVKNFDAFRSLLPGLLEAHRGEYALVCNGKLMGLFKSVKRAVISAQRRFPDEVYTICPVTDAPFEFRGSDQKKPPAVKAAARLLAVGR